MNRDLLRRVFLGALVALLLVNLANLGRNAESRPYQVAPKSTLAIGRDSAAWSVKAWFAVFEYLRKHLNGKQVTIPARLDRLAWSLERIARARVEVSSEPLELDGRSFRNLRRTATRGMRLLVANKRVELYVVLGGTEVDHYVLVQYQGESALMIMPEPTYRQLQGRATP